jgi:hypothetical protein
MIKEVTAKNSSPLDIVNGELGAEAPTFRAAASRPFLGLYIRSGARAHPQLLNPQLFNSHQLLIHTYFYCIKVKVDIYQAKIFEGWCCCSCMPQTNLMEIHWWISGS